MVAKERFTIVKRLELPRPENAFAIRFFAHPFAIQAGMDALESTVGPGSVAGVSILQTDRTSVDHIKPRTSRTTRATREALLCTIARATREALPFACACVPVEGGSALLTLA